MLAAMLPNHEFNEFGVNERGNTLRMEQDENRLSKTTYHSYAGRLVEVFRLKNEARDLQKAIDTDFKNSGFDVSTMKRGINAWIRSVKKPGEQDDNAVMAEWLEENLELKEALMGVIDLKEEQRAEWESKKTQPYNNRLDVIGAFSKENYRRATEDLGFTSDDFFREDLARRATHGEERAKRELWELDQKLAKERNLPILVEPDYIKELNKPKQFTPEEIQNAKIINAKTKAALEEFMRDNNLDENEEYWLDLKVNMSNFMYFQMREISEWYRVPEELRDPSMEYIIGMIVEYERYLARWYENTTEPRNPAMSTLITARLKTRGDISMFGETDQSKIDRYLDWCRNFRTKEYISRDDPNYQTDWTLAFKGLLRQVVYVGGYPYPDDLVKEGHPDGKTQGCLAYPEYSSSDYKLEEFNTLHGQPFHGIDPIMIPKTESHMQFKLKKLRSMLEIPELTRDILKTRGKFGEDLFALRTLERELHWQELQHVKDEPDFLDKCIAVVKEENPNMLEDTKLGFAVIGLTTIRMCEMQYTAETQTWEVTHQEEITDVEEINKIKEELKWPTEIAFLDLDNNPVTEEELTRTLEESTLWMVEDSRLGYNLEDDESYMRFKNANFYGIGHDVAIPVAGAPQPKDWVGEIVNAQGTLELQRLPPSKSCMERPLRTLHNVPIIPDEPKVRKYVETPDWNANNPQNLLLAMYPQDRDEYGMPTFRPDLNKKLEPKVDLDAEADEIIASMFE